MSNLTCDICEGKITIKAGGVAVCEVCGMEHSKERLLEKTQEIRSQSTSLAPSSKSQQIPIQQSNIASWLDMATSAQAASNNAEAEAYANRILEVDPEHWHAWSIKGSASGWQSNLKNLRLQETIQCFTKSLEFAPEERKKELSEILINELESLALAVVRLSGSHFVDYPVDVRLFSKNVSDVIKTVELFTFAHALELPGFRNNIAFIIYTACFEAWTINITNDYQGDDNHPNHYQFSTFIEHTGNCIELIEFAIALKERSIVDKTYYEGLIAMQLRCCSACSYTKWYNQYGTWYEKEYSLTGEAIRSRQTSIQKYREAIQQIIIDDEKKRIAQAEQAERFRISQNDEFWRIHSTQKDELIRELATLYVLSQHAKKDYTWKELDYIQPRIQIIERILHDNYTPTDQLPTGFQEIFDSQTDWHVRHASIRAADLEVTQWRIRERDSIRKQIAEQEVIIAQNQGFFGDPARTRKQAKQTKESLQTQLKQYSDLE